MGFASIYALPPARNFSGVETRNRGGIFMPTFEYKARTKEGESREGLIQAPSEEAAIDLLHENALTVFNIREKKEWSFTNLGFSFALGVRQRDIVIFSRQLATLFEAKIPMVQCLKTLIEESQRPALKKALTEISSDVSGGLILSQAIAKHPQIFSPFYVYMVRSGEESGKLEEVFSYLADYLERNYYLTNKARNAMIYPAVVILAAVGVIILLLVRVIPSLLSVFEESNVPLPVYTQIILQLSTFLQQWGIIILMVILGGALVLWRWSYTPEGKQFIHKLQLKIPLVGNLYKELYIARMTNTLQILLSSGIHLLRALSITADVVGNSAYKEAMHLAEESARGGSTISAAFEKVAEIPPLVTHMIRVGETAGKLDFILGSISKFYQQEVDRMVENIVSLIEPILILFLGGVVGLLIAAVFVPLYTLVGSL